MDINKLYDELGKLGLGTVWDADDKNVSIGNPSFANPLLWFNAYTKKEDYHGTISIKSINAPLFTGEQIKKSLYLVDTFLQTPLRNRGL
ncbi:hypothetical protein [Paraliobacillus ryukyuensis]|uniref:hypothetical protein n=1 Tax=Paraliobacillus ryukyuensis TaxID=200904 RepID=UPI00117E9824|nr:hypothetical protein [Paraliobacillus ryukyuensis]